MPDTNFDYFAQQVNERLKEGADRMTRMEASFNAQFKDQNVKLDALLAFKWQIFGGALVVSAAITIAIQIIYGAN